MTDPESSRLVPLDRPVDALCARLHLIDSAGDTIDAQYYEWHLDAVGSVVLDRLIAAADRGVRVRILVDDLRLWRSSTRIAALGRHPNIDIRVFNPWITRSGLAAIGYESVRRFRLLDHRMHNKLLVADGRVAVFGGRNLTESFFGLSDSFNLIDFDVLIASPATHALTDVFERYWASPSAVDAAELRVRRHQSLDEAKARVRGTVAAAGAKLRGVEERMSTIEADLEARAKPIHPDIISVVSDSPSTSAGADPATVGHRLKSAVGKAEHEVVAITAFFDPTAEDIDWYRSVASSGVRMALVTNSLATNPGTVSNAGLKKVRRSVIDAGVELYELKPHPACKPEWEIPPVSARYLGIHAKIYVVDRRRSIVGSVNLDPRSKHLNTEMSVAIEDEAFASQRADDITPLLHEDNSWRVVPHGEDAVAWQSGSDLLTRQPARGALQRTADFVAGLLPIERYL